MKGKSVSVLGRSDRDHTWTFTEDVAQMVAVAANDPKAWGHVWHTPSNSPRTQQQVADDLAAIAGVKPVHVRRVPSAVVRGLGLASPLMRELRETEYQFHDDFVMDSTAAKATFGLQPTPWDAVLIATLRSFGWSDPAEHAEQISRATFSPTDTLDAIE